MENFDTGSVLAVCALMTVLFGLIQISVWPIKKDIERLENRLDTELKEIKTKLDKLLARSSGGS